MYNPSRLHPGYPSTSPFGYQYHRCGMQQLRSGHVVVVGGGGRMLISRCPVLDRNLRHHRRCLIYNSRLFNIIILSSNDSISLHDYYTILYCIIHLST